MNLIEELVKKGVLEKKRVLELEKEIKLSGRKVEEVILEKKILPEEDLFNLKSEKLGIPLIKVDPEKIPAEILEIIPEETARYYKMVAISKKEGVLEIGMVWPEDLDAKEALKFLALKKNFDFKICLITLTNCEKILKQYQVLKAEMGKALEELERELKIEEIKVPTIAELGRIVEEAPISKAVATILRYGIEGEASDIHIEPFGEKIRFRFRLLGKLYSSLFLPIKVHPAIISRIKILSNLRIDETRIPQDGRFSVEFGGRKIDLRVSTFPTAAGEKVAIRILDPKIGLKKFDELGLAGRNYEVVKRAIQKPFGMILATGPTGCGKTTTLYAILQILNQEGINIVTLEDPIEYFIEGINQSQIRPEIGYNFATGLRHVLRQDPDVIMVGEIRDSETADLAVHAALTGHLVLSTLHTNNALGAIPRLIDLGIQPFLISPSLSLVIAQRLVRKLCPNCKKETKPKKEIKDLILKKIEEMPEQVKKGLKISPNFTIYEARGCKECQGKGFIGRVALFEILEMTKELGEIILKEPSESKIFQEAKKQGMITMRQDGILKVLDGITTIEEVLRETG